MADDPVRCGFEEQLRTLGVVDPIVNVSLFLGLLHPRLTTSEIGHARGPDFLAPDGR